MKKVWKNTLKTKSVDGGITSPIFCVQKTAWKQKVLMLE